MNPGSTQTFVFTDGRKLEYTYSASGQKLRMKFYEGAVVEDSVDYLGWTSAVLNSARWWGQPYIPGSGIAEAEFDIHAVFFEVQLLRPDGTSETVSHEFVPGVDPFLTPFVNPGTMASDGTGPNRAYNSRIAYLNNGYFSIHSSKMIKQLIVCSLVISIFTSSGVAQQNAESLKWLEITLFHPKIFNKIFFDYDAKNRYGAISPSGKCAFIFPDSIFRSVFPKILHQIDGRAWSDQ